MKELDWIDVKMAGVKDELTRLDAIKDLEEQGYQSAPLICQLTDCNPAQLFYSVVVNPEASVINQTRDRGIIRWCEEQMRKGELEA